MVKRKLDTVLDTPRELLQAAKSQKKSAIVSNSKTNPKPELSTKPRHANGRVTKPTSVKQTSVQIITGSYERVLHGFIATLAPSDTANHEANGPPAENSDGQGTVSFTDTFLFSAHSGSIRSVAVSPSAESHKHVLATGGSDERINLYNVSSLPPQRKMRQEVVTLSKTAVLENPKNRELGSLMHHSRAVTKLLFPTKGKLFSAAEDNTVAISRTRDWTVLSTIKVPIPKPVGRPSGDTAAAGEVPAGVNDFAIHPSMKLMVSVGKGEKSMRLWNLVTGKKAGVLSFDRELLAQVGEGRYGSGEGRRVLWTESGEDFVVGFERGAVVYGMDCKPKAVIRPMPSTKIHQMKFLPNDSAKSLEDVLALSTEDGRIVFYAVNDASLQIEAAAKSEQASHVICQPFAQLGGASAGPVGRIKDFELHTLPSASEQTTLLIVTGSSDGAVRLWTLGTKSLEEAKGSAIQAHAEVEKAGTPVAQQVGRLEATRETGNRITCMTTFVMDEPNEDEDGKDGEEEFGGFSDAADSHDDDDE